jgi:hypothetical protein
MIGRRRALGAAGASLLLASASARSVRRGRLDRRLLRALSFYRSIPLEDIYPPPKEPHVDLDDRAPFRRAVSIRADRRLVLIWLRIDGGRCRPPNAAKRCGFGPLIDGVACWPRRKATRTPRSCDAHRAARPVRREALFAHADGSFWRRHFTVRFLPTDRRHRLGVRRRRHRAPARGAVQAVRGLSPLTSPGVARRSSTVGE